MTDSEIIENLSKIDDELACAYEDCPIYRKNLGACADGKEVCLCLSEAKKLIKHQKTEIERLKTSNDALRMAIEICKGWEERAKAEAIKEFAERLKENFGNPVDDEEADFIWIRYLIDETAKGMVGE